MIQKFRTVLEMIKFEHTIFALPFAMISMMLASRSLRLVHGIPTGSTIFWILVAMVSARSAAMAFNRLVDWRYDAQNPRTAMRAIPAKQISERFVVVFTVLCISILIFAAAKLNRLCLELSPIALMAILGYSYCKRFTAYSHLVLGFAIGLAPIGAWVAVTGKFALTPLLLGLVVMLWIGGFDIIYALQDDGFDKSAGLRSIPQTFGRLASLKISRAMHCLMLFALVLVGVTAGLQLFYFVGVVVVASLIVYEQSLVSPSDLSRVNLAFFTLNGWVSVCLLGFVILDRLLQG